MKIKRGTDHVKLPDDYSIAESVGWIGCEDDNWKASSAAVYPLSELRWLELAKIRESPSGKIIGIPRHFAVLRGYVDPKNVNVFELHFWPRTDRDGELRIRYRLPSKEV